MPVARLALDDPTSSILSPVPSAGTPVSPVTPSKRRFIPGNLYRVLMNIYDSRSDATTPTNTFSQRPATITGNCYARSIWEMRKRTCRRHKEAHESVPVPVVMLSSTTSPLSARGLNFETQTQKINEKKDVTASAVEQGTVSSVVTNRSRTRNFQGQDNPNVPRTDLNERLAR